MPLLAPGHRFFGLALLCLGFGVPAPAQEPAPYARGERLIHDYFRHATRRVSEACLADLRTLQEWRAGRPEFRRQFLEMVGLWPLPPRSDLKPVVTGKVEADGFTIEKLHFQSMPGLYVTGNLYVPRQAKLPAPAVLYVCGH